MIGFPSADARSHYANLRAMTKDAASAEMEFPAEYMYPKAIVDYANTRGADKIMYAGYYPMGLSMERIMTDMPNVPFNDEVWPKFLRGNADRVFRISEPLGNAA